MKKNRNFIIVPCFLFSIFSSNVAFANLDVFATDTYISGSISKPNDFYNPKGYINTLINNSQNWQAVTIYGKGANGKLFHCYLHKNVKNYEAMTSALRATTSNSRITAMKARGSSICTKLAITN